MNNKMEEKRKIRNEPSAVTIEILPPDDDNDTFELNDYLLYEFLDNNNNNDNNSDNNNDNINSNNINSNNINSNNINSNV
ncbi:hypothetical protein PMALA_005610 [Plasmodium malariae]|uniref:Uncharacterized protein n=1 Tax=Plasmodium malariae TaxID=5858 RepID=A0A1A8VUU6_PLAMA|nr:hypothetical protein PMALA_005610 [Plasmodium malariae]